MLSNENTTKEIKENEKVGLWALVQSPAFVRAFRCKSSLRCGLSTSIPQPLIKRTKPCFTTSGVFTI